MLASQGIPSCNYFCLTCSSQSYQLLLSNSRQSAGAPKIATLMGEHGLSLDCFRAIELVSKKKLTSQGGLEYITTASPSLGGKHHAI
jgi:hypothetical protein